MNDTPASPVTLAELARATEDLPFAPPTETPAAPTSCGASLATRSLAEVFAAEAEGHDPLAPSPEDIATLTTQYRKAVNGLYEAYLFGQMLLAVQKRLSLSLTRETKGEWHAPAGSGIKGWLAKHCPEINYKTALRFLAVAEKTNAALAESEAVPASPRAGVTPAAGEGARNPFPSETPFLLTFPEETIRAFLEGKSQRQILKAPKAEPAVRHAMSEEERAEKLAEVCKGFLQRLEGVERTGESDLLRLDDRREIVTRLKALARRLEQAVEG